MLNIDVKLRYLPLIRFIKKNKKEGESILEVGGGDIGISRFLDEKITICDTCFKDREISSNKVISIYGDARKLPFKDNSYDFVLSSDMLEHIDEKDRKKAIREMLRVSRNYVIAGVPCGEKSHIYEKRIFNFIKKLTGKEHKWLKEHVANGIPDEKEIKSYFDDYNLVIINNANLNLWFINELFNPYLWFIPWIFYPVFAYFIDKGYCYRKIFIASKEVKPL